MTLTLSKTVIRFVGCRGERLHAQFGVTSKNETARLEVSCKNPSIDIRAIAHMWQNGRSVGAEGKFLAQELLLKDSGIIRTDSKSSFLRDSAGNLHCLTGEDAYLPSDLRFHDTEDLQAVVLKAGETKMFWVTCHVDDKARNWNDNMTVTMNGEHQNIVLETEILPFRLDPPKLLIGMYYVQCLTDIADPPLSSRHAVSEPRMRAELKLMRNIGVNYPSLYYASRYGDAPRKRAIEMRKQCGFPTDKLFSTVNRVDAGNDNALIACISIMRKKFADYHDHYLYGHEEQPDLSLQYSKWNLCRSLGAKSWLAIRPDTAKQAAGYLDLALLGSKHQTPVGQEYVDTIHNGGYQCGIYDTPHIGQDAWTWRIRRNYGWMAWAFGYDAIFPHAFRNYSHDQHPWSDWSGESPYRPIVAAYPTTNGCIPTVQIEKLGDAIRDLRYIATLEASIENAPLSKISQRRRAVAWLQFNRESVERIKSDAEMDALKLEAIHHIRLLAAY